MKEKIKTSFSIQSFKLDLLDKFASEAKRSRNFFIEQAIDDLIVRKLATQQTLQDLYTTNQQPVLPTIGISEKNKRWGRAA